MEIKVSLPAFQSSTSFFRYGYTNEYSDTYIKLIYLRSRMYSPASGRFTTKDSWQGDYNRPLSLNRWNYVEGNPVNLTDPSGHGPLHFSVIVNYAYRYGFWPEFIIPPTVPPAPRGPGRWGLRIDLTDFKNYEIYEVEPYSGGVYPPGHGPAQVNHYLQILNQAYGGIGVSFVHNWNPGRYLPDEKFYADPTQFVFVHAWWEQPGVIVYTATLSPKALLVGSEVLLAVLGGRLLKDVIGSRKEPGLAPQGVGICPDNLFPGLITIPSGDMPPGPVEFPPLEFPLEFPLVIP